jgi:hypothetical protein
VEIRASDVNFRIYQLRKMKEKSTTKYSVNRQNDTSCSSRLGRKDGVIW